MSDMLSLNGIVVDLGNETLRDAAGNPLVLRPQCFAVLRCLSERPNRLVTKDELMQAVWPGTAVTDDSLVQCIHEIRQAVKDEQRTVLKTVPKRGYRLDLPENTARAETAAIASLQSARPRSANLAVIAAAALLLAMSGLAFWLVGRPASGPVAAGVPPAVAVLPFDALSDDPGPRFAAGMTEDLITDLARLPGVSVIARNAAAGLGDRSAAIDEAARELGLKYVLVGSVRHAGDRVRINAHLIDALTRHLLWAERYDGNLGDSLALQAQVASDIVSAVQSELRNAGRPANSQSRPTGTAAGDIPVASPNRPPTAVTFENVVASIPAGASTAKPIRVADVTAADDGLGTNLFGLSGEDAQFFEIVGQSLYLRAGVALHASAKAAYTLAVDVDDKTVGSSPDASGIFTLRLSEVAVGPGTGGTLD